MYELENISWSWLFLLIILISILFIFDRAWKIKTQKLFFSKSNLERLSPNISNLKPIIKIFFMIIGISMFIIAMINPKIGTKIETFQRLGVDIVFAVDVSKSMLAEDIAPSRIEKSKQLVGQVINNLGGDRIGIVAYAGKAFPQLPLTTDYSSAKMFLQNMNTDMLSSQGTAIDEAIRLSSTYFDQDQSTERLLFIVSDGEDHNDLSYEMADLAAKNNITIYSIGVGTEKGSPIPIKKNGIVYATETSSPTDGNATISAGLNSNAVSNSPASKTFNVVAYGYGGNTVKETVTVKVKNDDNPNINSLVTVVDCDPGEEKTVNLGTLDEVDMPVWITCTEGSINNSLGQKKVGAGNNINLKAFALPYEVDITGRESNDTGKRASKTITLQIGPHKSHDVVFRTVRPTIKETFDSVGSVNNLPYPKINLGSSSPSEYINASSVDVDNIDITRAEINSRLESGEISTEVKVSDDECQIKRNSGSWKVPRGI